MSNETIQESAPEQRDRFPEPLVRLPSVRASKSRVRVLQKWVGRVENFDPSKFTAVIEDASNASNAPEYVEIDIEEISPSDFPLLAEGAVFYWAIGYRDTVSGQRERISILRFARQPRLSVAEMIKISQRADELASILERE